MGRRLFPLTLWACGAPLWALAHSPMCGCVLGLCGSRNTALVCVRWVEAGRGGGHTRWYDTRENVFQKPQRNDRCFDRRPFRKYALRCLALNDARQRTALGSFEPLCEP